jgi:50S ribosomal subunit-associated GTPase HflX
LAPSLHPLACRFALAPRQATLEEVTEADLLLHVLDASSPQALRQRSAVLGVLRGLGVSEERLRGSLIEVWNKADQLAEGGGGSAGQLQDAGGGKVHSPGAPQGGGAAASGDGGGLAAAAQQAGSPRTVAGVLEAAAAGGYRPLAVATSVLRRQGLRQLMEAIESKVRPLRDVQAIRFAEPGLLSRRPTC